MTTTGAGQAPPSAAGAPATRPLVRVRIERLVLHGLEVGDGRAVARVLEAELAARLARGQLPPLLATTADHPRLPAPAIRFDPATDPGDVGRRVAEVLDAGLRR
jgi:hypothetical protein